MTTRTHFVAVLAALASLSIAVSATAQSNDNGNKYGLGKPEKVRDLPPGQLRNKLESLPKGLQKKALEWMQRHDFPEQDVPNLDVNADGDLFYADYGLVQSADPLDLADGPVTAEALPDDELFSLHSKPGSGNVLFLDFDGHVITGTAWNVGRADPLVAVRYSLSYDPDGGDPPPPATSFTDEERKRIHEIWHRIAEDYAPYDIDVTTEEPAVFTRTTGHVLFTHDVDANGNAMPALNAGGVAYVGPFGASYYGYYSPALVYYTNLYTNFPYHGDATLIAEAGSHEFGHNLNLSHDGDASDPYYPGHDSGLIRWGPIMGGSYSDSVTQFSQGEYPGANNSQDDLAIIAAYLGYDSDDEGDSSASASALTVEANGDVLVSNPETDPENLLPGNKGVIQDRDDVDWWYIDAGAGALSLTVTPAWHAFNSPDYRSFTYRGANLDVEAELYDAALNLLDSDDPVDDTVATVSATVPGGRYYLRIDGVGNSEAIGYTDYASIGMYFIEGSSAPAVTDTDPPSPDPMTWATAPNATGPFSMNMVATAATDPSGVEYNFVCVAGDIACVDSGWQAGNSFDATGLTHSTYYSWRVQARDGAGNVTGFSSTLGDTTDAVTPPDGAPTALTATGVSTSRIDLAWSDNSSNESGFEIERSADGSNWSAHASVGADVTAYADTGLNSHEKWHYRVFARNVGGDSPYSNEAQAVTLAECNVSTVVDAGAWRMISLPCDPGSLNTVADVFDVLDPGLYGTSWFVYEVANVAQQTRLLGLADTMAPGTGYLLFSATGFTLTARGFNLPASNIPLVSNGAEGRWNFIGFTGSGTLDWADVVPMDGAAEKSWKWADGLKQPEKIHHCDFETVTTECRVLRVFQKWNGNSFEPFDPDLNPGQLSAFDTVLVKSHYGSANGLHFPQTLAAPATAAAAPGVEAAPPAKPEKTAKPKKNKGDWFIRLVAESGKYRDRANFLGQLADSSDGPDGHDHEEMPPIGAPFLSILFENPAFEAVPWGYSSDLRAVTSSPQGEWTFVVRATPGLGEITLSWQGDREVYASATLEDAASGARVRLSDVSSYRFAPAPDGVNRFRIVVE